MTSAILVVDDDLELQENISEVLVKAGFAVTVASDGLEALDALQSGSYDLVLLDLMMPRMGGMEALLRIRQLRRDVQIVMITAFATVQSAVEAMKLGANDYLPKPFKVNDLLTTVRRNLEEVKFKQRTFLDDIDGTLHCLANSIRRQILRILQQASPMRFMDIVRELEISDHTKVNFHLKALKGADLIAQNGARRYALTEEGYQALDFLTSLAQSTKG